MAILIKETTTSPRKIGNGATNMTISFKGQTIGEPTADVIIEFIISSSSFPELSFNDGLKKISESFKFTNTEQSFSKKVTIQNNISPADNLNYRNDQIELIASDHKTHSSMSDNVAIKFI
jgi:hypothetical protein